MVDPHRQTALPPSLAEPTGQREFCVTSGDLGTHGMHPPRKRIHIYGESGITAKNPTVAFSCAGGHSGPPLRGGFVSLGTNTNIDRSFVTYGDLGTHGMHPPRKRIHIYGESGITAKNPTVAFSCAGGHSGPPLRGGFVTVCHHVGSINGFVMSRITNTRVTRCAVE
jgi:hypothetical protein